MSLESFVLRGRLAVNPSFGEIDATGQKVISSMENKKKKKKGGKKEKKKQMEKKGKGESDCLEKSSNESVERNAIGERATVFQRGDHENRGRHTAWKTARVHENSQAVAPSKLAKALGG